MMDDGDLLRDESDKRWAMVATVGVRCGLLAVLSMSTCSVLRADEYGALRERNAKISCEDRLRDITDKLAERVGK